MVEKDLPRKKRGVSRRQAKMYAYILVGVVSLVGAVISSLRHDIVSSLILSVIGIAIMVMGALD